MRAYELEESAVEELKDRLPKLKVHDYNTIDRLMNHVSSKHKITGKKLHDMFVRKYGHTPDAFIKKITNRLGEEGVAEGIETVYGKKYDVDPNKYYVWAWDGAVVLYGEYDNVEDAKMNLPKLEKKAIERLGPYVKDAFELSTGKDLLHRYGKKGVAEGLNEFAPDGFNGGGDDDEGFSPEIAKMAQEDGFTKGAGLADGATLERAITINHWHSQHGGMYKQYFAKGFKAGRMDKIRHSNKQYNLNLKLMKDGSIRHGEQGVAEEWSQKYKSSINCSHPKGFSQKAHCAGKKKHNESVESHVMEMVCEDCGMCQTHGDSSRDTLDEACWKGYHKEGNKKMFGKTYPNCVKNEGVAEGHHNESCPHCGGEMVSEELVNEKKDACYYKVKSRYKVWPSAYASGALVKCRKKGSANWGNGGQKSESMTVEQLEESLHDWFNKEKWVRMDTKGNIKGPCAREPGEGKPKCLPQSKAHNLGKKGRASAAQRKRREDPNPDRSGSAINVNTKKKTNEGEVVPLVRPMSKVQYGKRTFPPTQRSVKEPEGNITPLNQKKSNVSEGVEGPEDIQKIKDFIKWSYKTLNMQKPYPKITISKNTEVAQAGHHTGVHKGDKIWVYVGNRNMIDIFRTIFHELTHHRQMQLNMIKDGDSYPGSPIEMLADMAAGKYIKIYGKNHPEMFQ